MTIDHSAESERSPRRFETTHWSLVLSAGHRSSPDAHQAMCELCEKYWYPLYAYVRRRVSDVHEAQDLTQAFFAKLLEKNYVAEADPQRGKFRTFLLTSLSHFLANEWDKTKAQKRGGDRFHFSLDFNDGERRFSRDPATDLTPEREYERQWAISLLQQVLQSLRCEAVTAGKEQQFDELKECLTRDKRRSYAAIAEQLGMSESAVKVAVHRLRRKYGQQLRRSIAETVADPVDVDEEIARLFGALS